MRYEGTVYRPPSEAGSLIIQATVGCPHNLCAFCSMYSDKKFKKRPVEDIVEDLDMALDAYGAGVRTIFLADGNSAALPADSLIAVGEAARERFPHLERITMYGSAKFLAKKDREEWLLEQCSVVLDHTPMGDFVEVEGPPERLERVARLLGLDAETAVRGSYVSLWVEYRELHPELDLPANMVFTE